MHYLVVVIAKHPVVVVNSTSRLAPGLDYKTCTVELLTVSLSAITWGALEQIFSRLSGRALKPLLLITLSVLILWIVRQSDTQNLRQLECQIVIQLDWQVTRYNRLQMFEPK